MKVAFIQRDAYEKIGVQQLAACLKYENIACDVFVKELEKDFYNQIKAYQPDFVLYSLYIGEEEFMLRSFSKLKRMMPKIKTVIGGAFALIFPQIARKLLVDFVIRGDGEHSLPLFLKLHQQKSSIRDVPGICFIDKNGKLYINDNVQLISDLNSVPSPDRDLYYKYEFLRRKKTKMFIASRGCPFNCTYCYNAQLKKFFETRYWRHRNPEHVFSEIKYVRDTYGLEWVHFQDGTFNADKKWLKVFLEGYKNFGLPEFLCNARVENIDEEIVCLLKDAGCDRITFGVQSGDPNIRCDLAGRPMRNENIIEACNLCKAHGIRVSIDIIFGWPGESLASAMETIKLCRQVDAETYSSNVLVFYPGLQITDYAYENGYIEKIPSIEEINRLDNNKSLLVDVEKRKLINMDKFFYYLIKFPILEKWLLFLMQLPPNRFFFMLKNVHLLVRSLKYDNAVSRFRTIMNYIIYGWRAVS